MLDHFGREVAHELVFELCLEGEPGAPGDVERAPAEGFIHGKEKAEAADAALVAEREPDRFAERKPRILHRVVAVDLMPPC